MRWKRSRAILEFALVCLLILFAPCALRAERCGLPLKGVEFGDSFLQVDTVRGEVDSVVEEVSVEDFASRRESDLQGQGDTLRLRGSGKHGRWRHFCDSLGQGWVALIALTLPGGGQVLNRDYWKLPVFYGGIAMFSYGAYFYGRKYNRLGTEPLPGTPLEALRYEDVRLRARMGRDGMIAGACITYAASVADALISHSPNRQSATAAMVSSALLPGLGQIYNRSFWKLPLIYGGLSYLISEAVSDHQLYVRYERAYVALADDDPLTVDEFNGQVPLSTLEYGASYYRRYRDLSIIGIALVYALNIIDAYVDAHLFYWNVNEDITVRAEPQVAVNHLGVRRGVTPSMHVSVLF